MALGSSRQTLPQNPVAPPPNQVPLPPNPVAPAFSDTNLIQLEGTELVTTPAIQAVGMAINTELSLLICMECEAAFTAENYMGHLQRAHKEIKIPKELKNLVHAQHISDVYPYLAVSSTPRRPLAGLSVTPDQRGCPHCPFAGCRVGVATHIKIHPQPHSKIQTGLSTQALNKGIIIARNPIRVIAPNVVRPNPEVHSDLSVEEGVARDDNTGQNSVQRPEEVVIEQSKMLSEMYAMTKGLVAAVHNLQTNMDRIESILTNKLDVPSKVSTQANNERLSSLVEEIQHSDIDPPLRADKGKGRAVESPLIEPNNGVFSDDDDNSVLFNETLAPYLEDDTMPQASLLEIDQTQAMPSEDTSAHFIDISSDDEDVMPIVPALSSKMRSSF
ncbi:hypothetical protein K438DRAFT_1994431 [Mycena galopus ATCC 62051]|nr:hypothetical protein K438DRAFT_1994431 [Mycena galopus ATCC 62051]